MYIYNFIPENYYKMISEQRKFSWGSRMEYKFKEKKSNAKFLKASFQMDASIKSLWFQIY